MASWSRPLIGLIVAYGLVWGALAAWTLAGDTSHFFEGDAAGYHEGAVSLVEHGTYWFHGIPYTEREPLQSMWLAGIYLFGGIGNLGAVFAAQGVLLLLASLFFVQELRRHASDRAALICLGLLLFFPGILHAVFSLNRELITLACLLFFARMTLAMVREGSGAKRAVAAGFLLGLATLGYASNMLLPFFLIPLYFVFRMRWQHVVTLLVCAAVPMGIWGARNYVHEGQFCIAGCYRTNNAWGVRGEQAEALRGWDPLRCLYAEYITRDWNGLPDTCNFNAVMHRLWPHGLNLDERDGAIGERGRQKILQNFPHYLWFCVFEVLELHLPYVNGWGRVYNLLAVAATLLLYGGIPFAGWWLRCRTREGVLLLAIIVYNTGIFALTDAVPRYLVPALFAYAALSAIGYDWLLSRISSWRRSAS